MIWLSGCSLPSVNSTTASQFTKDTTAISAYLVQNNIHATKLPSGVWFIVDSASRGIRATYNDTVSVTYAMKILPSGTVADQSSVPVQFTLLGLIQGIQTAMPQFPNGSRGRIFIPSDYGYQTSPVGSIPANSNLIFDFKLKDVKDKQLGVDTIAINAYLAGHNIHALSDPSGVKYTIDSLGTGGLPSANSFVTVNYSVSELSTGNVLGTTSGAKIQLSNHIIGFQIGMTHIPEGSVCTLYVPSPLAYGPFPPSGVPTKATLIFTVKLLKVSAN